MLISIIILVISIILDGIITNFIPYLVNDLSLFTPMFTLISILLITPFYKKRKKQYFITLFVVGIIYDLLYTNLLFFNGCIFLILGFLFMKIHNTLKTSYFKFLLYIIITIVLYESLTGLILFIYQMVPITISKIFYKITHSLILNIIYGEVLFFIINKLPNRYKKININ